MQNQHPATATNISNVDSSLTDFYHLISRLSRLRFVRMMDKEDEADHILWTFTYRKRKFTLQYSIYNGVSLLSEQSPDQRLIDKLATKLRLLTS